MGFSARERLEKQRGMIARGQFNRLGRLSAIVFDPDGMDAPDWDPGKPATLAALWYGLRRAFTWENGERVLAEAESDRFSGDPVFQRNMLYWPIPNSPEEREQAGPEIALSVDQKELLLIEKVNHPPDVTDTRQRPFVSQEQRYRDRTTICWGEFLVIQPVVQVLYKPYGAATYALVPVSSQFDGSKMAFLIDPKTQEGHLLGGKFGAPRQPDAWQPQESIDQWQRLQQAYR